MGTDVVHMWCREGGRAVVDRRGFGRIRRWRSGRYGAGYVGPDTALHWSEQTFETKDAAVLWLAQERRQLETDPDTWLPPRDRQAAADTARAAAEAALPPTFAEYSNGWLESRPLKPRTVAEYRKLLDAHLLPTLGRHRLDALTPAIVRNWYTAMGPNRPTRRAHAYGLLRTILATAMAEQLVGMNPCTIRAGGSAKTVHKAQPATLEELAAIVEHMPERLQLAVLIAAWCGLRQGEILELRRRDIDLTARVIRVRRAVTRVAGVSPIVGAPKSDAGVRDVAIPPHLVPEFERHLSSRVLFGRDALLFVGRDSGEQLASSTLYRWFYPAREAAGRKDLRWHDLRHTGATLAAATGATLAELMNRLGHSTVGAAMRYQHAAQDRDQAIAEALSRMAQPVPLIAAAGRLAGGSA